MKINHLKNLSMSQANILVVEDDPTIAIDITLQLEEMDYEVVDTIHRAEEAESILEKRNVDLVMLDINLEGEMSGIDLGSIIQKKYNIPFVYLTSYSDEDTLTSAAHTFPAGYLVKPFKQADLSSTIKMALIRSRSKDDNAIPSLDRINNKAQTPLTQSEYNTISHIWLGKTNKEIATEIYVSVNTVKSHISNTYTKLDVHSKPELISWLRKI